MLSDIFSLFAPFISAVVITTVLVPLWITVCNKWHLLDKPDERKHHISGTPSMGGLAIFAGIIISFFIFSSDYEFGKLKFILGASFLLFFTGFFDDLLGITPFKKFLMQVIASAIIMAGGIRLTNLYGVFGINEIPLWTQYPLTLLVIIAFINAYNFIDGIDGLAATLGVVSTAIFGFLLFRHGEFNFALFCFCFTGALLGFLFFNFHPAKIFMGDTGSLVIGLVIITGAINLLSSDAGSSGEPVTVSPALIFSVLFIPVYDFIRVIAIRILNGESTHKPDRNHIHHMILRQGFGHFGAVMVLITLNLIIMAMYYAFGNMNINGFILVSICASVLCVNSFVMQWLAALRNRIFGEEKKSAATADEW
jgi:UDP-GlcNAc:undecaprenyl-phosphate/decaprenyl-phosphate GlcNAc-1-phosphate transferase